MNAPKQSFLVKNTRFFKVLQQHNLDFLNFLTLLHLLGGGGTAFAGRVTEVFFIDAAEIIGVIVPNCRRSG